MRASAWASAVALIASQALFAAHEPAADCGTQPGRLQQEMFLHQRHVLSRAMKREGVVRDPTPVINQNVGSIAVMDDSGGVIGRRNPFDLDGKTLIFRPGGRRSSVQRAAGRVRRHG